MHMPTVRARLVAERPDADARAQRLDAGYSVAIGFRYLRAASVSVVSVSVVFLLVTVSVFTVST